MATGCLKKCKCGKYYQFFIPKQRQEDISGMSKDERRELDFSEKMDGELEGLEIFARIFDAKFVDVGNLEAFQCPCGRVFDIEIGRAHV